MQRPLLYIFSFCISSQLIAQNFENQFNINDNFNEEFGLEGENEASPNSEPNQFLERNSGNLVEDFPNVNSNSDNGISETEDLAKSRAKANEALPLESVNAVPEDPIDVVPTTEAIPSESVSDVLENRAVGEPVPPQDVGPNPVEVVEVNDFSGVPFFPGKLRGMAMGEAPEAYKIEDGDTLFDICDQLLDESDYWPKLWALNPKIKNPHFIYPGMSLSFYPGNDEAPPFLEVVAEEEIIPVDNLDTGAINEKILVGGNIDRLLLESRSEDVIVEDPPAQVSETVVPGTTEMSEIEAVRDYEEMNQAFEPDRTEIVLPAFYLSEKMDDYGDVIVGSLGSHFVGKDAQVVVDTDESLQVGTLYTIVRRADIEESGAFAGYRYDFIAHGYAESTLESGDQVIRTRQSYRGVKPGDLIVEYQSTRRFFREGAFTDSTQAPDASIIGFAIDSQTMGGQNSIVFVDAPLNAGAVFPIYNYQDEHMPNMLGISRPEQREKVGTLQVIGNFGEASVGIVMYSILDVRLGDTLGKG